MEDKSMIGDINQNFVNKEVFGGGRPEVYVRTSSNSCLKVFWNAPQVKYQLTHITKEVIMRTRCSMRQEIVYCMFFTPNRYSFCV